MHHRRSGTTLCEVLLATVLIASAAAWALTATSAAERALGRARLRADAIQRAEFALSALQQLPCDTLAVARVASETRWQLLTTRTTVGTLRLDHVELRDRRGDTLHIARHRWCTT